MFSGCFGSVGCKSKRNECHGLHTKAGYIAHVIGQQVRECGLQINQRQALCLHN